LLETYAGRAPDLAAWLEGSQINRDRNLRLQYLAGMGINSGAGALIYSALLAHYRYPEGLFVGSAENIQALRKALQVSQQNP
jgi:spermidine synthase